MAVEITSSTLRCRNPATMQLLGEIPISEPGQIAETIHRARIAQEQWRQVPIQDRLALIENFRRVLFENSDKVATLITQEVGKPKAESLVSEIFAVLETCRWLCEEIPYFLRPNMVRLNPIFFPGKFSYNVFEPLGIVAVISPWNYPFSIPATTMLAALALGNGIVLKPSPRGAMVAQMLIALFHDAGFPKELVGIVQGDRLEAEYLILGGVNRVMFTGSTPGGKAIMNIAARKLVPVTLELGGKHAAIVVGDSDLDTIATQLVWGGMTNAGQACASIERIYCDRAMSSELARRMAEVSRELKIGNGLEPDTDVGPLIDPSEVGRIHGMVEQAITDGAESLCGGRPRSDLGPSYYAPTILANANPRSRVVREEVFGPVVPIVPWETIDDAIRAVNDSDVGLGASIWTKDTERAEIIAHRIEAGMVWINDGLYTHVCPDAPWGGIKNSGFGRMHSSYEFLELVSIKNISITQQKKADVTFPYTQATFDYIRNGVRLLHGKVDKARLNALLNLLMMKKNKK